MGEHNFGHPLSSDPNNSNNKLGYTSSPGSSYELSGKIMLSAIVILFTVVILIICLHVYARCFLVRARRRNNLLRRRAQRRTTHLVFVTDSAESTTTNNPAFLSRGLDAAVLKSLPTFVFSTNTTTAKTAVEVLECAVCLSEFEENEKGRLLPKCNHSFHTDCIDMWFLSHSTCPICRSPVNNPQTSEPEKPEAPQIQIVIDSEPTSSSSETPCPTCRNEETENGPVSSSSSSSSNSTVGARRKVFELVGVSIEVPRREESFRNSEEEIQSSPGSQGFRSPGSRMMALKRILSREKRSPVSSSLSLCGSVPEIDPERGHEEQVEEPATTVQTSK